MNLLCLLFGAIFIVANGQTNPIIITITCGKKKTPPSPFPPSLPLLPSFPPSPLLHAPCFPPFQGAGCAKSSHFDVSVDGGPVEASPTILVTAGQVYAFDINTPNHPVALHTAPGQISPTFRYSSPNLINNVGVTAGTIVWVVPADAPTILYYQSETSFALFGRIDKAGATVPTGAAPTAPATVAPTVPERFWTPVCEGFDASSGTGGTGGSFTGAEPAPVQGASPETNPKYQEKVRRQEQQEAEADEEFDLDKELFVRSQQTTRSHDHPPTIQFGLGTRNYYCSTSTRAEQLMDLALFTIVRESSAASETCFEKGAPGIFTPVGSARFYMAIGVVQFNAWSVFDLSAKPVRAVNAPAKRTASRDRTKANKELAMTFAVYETLKFLLPNRASDIALSLFNAYGLEMESPAKYGFAAQVGVDAAADWISNHLAVDGSNQARCYKSTVPDVRKDAPVNLGTLETVNASLVNRVDLWTWADLRIPGLVGDRPFLTNHAYTWTRVAIENPAELLPTESPLPSHEQLDAEMRAVAALQAEFANNPARKVQVALWADGPKSSLPPGHWEEIAIDLVARRRGYDLDTATKLLLLISVVNYEAGVACWEQKELYRTVRPQEYISLTMMLEDIPNSWGGVHCPLQTLKGWAWRDYAVPALNTPPFPEYPSGHSTFSNASATVIALFTGSDSVYGDPISLEFKKGLLGFKNKFGWEQHCFANGTSFDGTKCSFVKCARDPAHDSSTDFAPSTDGALGPFYNWTGMAYNAGESRLYGGYHPQSGNIGGLTLGREVGIRVFNFLCKNHIGDCSVGKQATLSAASTLYAQLLLVALLISLLL